MIRFARTAWGVGLTAALLAAPLTATADQGSGHLGALSGVHVDGATVTLDSGAAKVRLSFPRSDAARIWLAPDGRFTDPAGTTIMPAPSAPPVTAKQTDKGDYLAFSTGKLTLRAYKKPLTFAMYDGADQRRIWAESTPLSWTAKDTTQTLQRKANEQFYGGGEQNGSYSHRDKTIKVFADDNWDEGGAPNSQPFYGSTAGYGVLRNTFAPGSYSFTDPVRTTESERRFDAVYVVGKQPKDVVSGYTDLVGKPFLPPIYGLEMGDSDCYLHNANRGERHTTDALKVAKGYQDHQMPNGWMLVNDGYGCGYENLPKVGKGLQDKNMQLGLWTQDGLPNQQQEVKAGVRVRKLDVAWVGPGYKMSLDACQTAKSGIEDNSSARGFVWQPISWAGIQRCGVVWSGDQSGSWNYIRWQIPAYAGSTMSGIAYNTGDVDGIFGGSPKTYVRDLQWKTFLPVAMTMDGWADKDKQPWVNGEPYTSINRKYLDLRERLMPYTYSYSVQAHETGVGQVRPLALEYPNDPKAWSDSAKYEFLSGKDFLVAPVYSDTSVRDGIYLPRGKWTDYWTGKTYEGQRTIDGYHAPLGKLPLFVKAGAVVPMWPQGTKSWQTRDKSVQDVDVYPSGHSAFTLAEDDGVTRSDARSKQEFKVTAPETGPGTVTVHIGQRTGEFAGKAGKRAYDLSVHTGTRPAAVKVGAKVLPREGWSYRNGVVHVRTADIANADRQTVSLLGTSAVGGRFPHADNTSMTVQAPKSLVPGQSAEGSVTFTNDTGLPVRLTALGATAPKGVSVESKFSPKVVAPGQTVRQDATVRVTEGVEPGTKELRGSAEYAAFGSRHTADYATEVSVPYASLAAANDNVGAADAAHVKAANFDGDGGSFRAEGLAAAGLSHGKEFSARGATMTWPSAGQGRPDNTVAAGQTIALSGKGKSVVLAGSASGTKGSGKVTVHYTDGTSSSADTGFPNWCCADPAKFGASVLASVKGKNTATGPAHQDVDYRMFDNSVLITQGKQVASVTLPDNRSMHVFGLGIGT